MNEKEIRYIDSQELLDACVSHIQDSDQIAIDLEFDKNRYRYGFNVCLIQVLAGDVCYLIDPLPEGIDLEELYRAFENPAILKVVFSFREDLALLHSLGCKPNNLYDIGVAIRLLDMPQSNLAVVCEHYLGIQLDKDAQMSNWFQRPLTEAQMHYAAMDVRYLLLLKDRIMHKVAEHERTEWVDQENMYWEEMDYSVANSDNPVKEKYKRDFDQVGWHVFQRLIEYREEIARDNDLPRGRVMRDDYLKEIILTNGLRYWTKNRSIHRSIRTEEYKKEATEIKRKAEAEALEMGLEKGTSAKEKLSREAYQEFRQLKRDEDDFIDQIAKPVQREMAAALGEFTANYIMSNRLAADLFRDPHTPLPAYRKTQWVAAAERLDFTPELQEVFDEKLG